MKPAKMKEHLVNALFPTYERKFKTVRPLNVMNVSWLVRGARSYLYDLQSRDKKIAKTYNHHLIRGSAGHAYISKMLHDEEETTHLIKYRLPYVWKNKPYKDIILLGHYDNIFKNCLMEHKFPEKQASPGTMACARRQLGAYAKMFQFTKDKTFEDYFIVYLNHDINLEKLTPAQIEFGWNFVKKTAREVARSLDLP